MPKDYQATPQLYKGDIKLKLPIEQVLKFQKRCDELGMTSSQYVIFLMEGYDGNNINNIINFRESLNKRIKKGINRLYINQLIRLQTQIDTILNKL
jgi:hypothetical protein